MLGVMKYVLPPIVTVVILKLWRKARGIGFFTFRGHWQKLEDVPVDRNSYNDPELVSRLCSSRLSNIVSSRKRDELPDPETDDCGKSILPLITCIELLRGRELTILDIGGGWALI